MKLNRLVLLLFLLPLLGYGQPNPYLFPIRPGQQNFLAGTMGELRTGHFHGGLDIKTSGKIGLPVQAAADGYISRINVNAGGYGHALYLTHSDGTSTVYGHLDRFAEEIEDFTRARQYEEESYEIRLFPDKNQFVFKKGDVIAYSGNTGSSSGPHLHFEIRDADQHFMNPLSYGFDEIKDNLPPILKRIAFVTLEKNARVNGAFGRYEFDVIKVNGKYTTTKPIQLEGAVGIQIYHYDNMNGTWSRNGIPELAMLIDGDTVFHQIKEKMSFGKNRSILVHYDFGRYRQNGRKFNKLYLEDGNDLSIYKQVSLATFDYDVPRDLRLVLRDNHNNFSVFETTINNRRIVYEPEPTFQDYLIRGNYMHLVSSDTLMHIYHGYQVSHIQPYRVKDGKTWFVWDLRDGLPDSIVSGGCSSNPNFYTTVPSGYEFEFFNAHFDIRFNRKTLFDTLYLQFEKEVDSVSQQEYFIFHNTDDPLRQHAILTLKPQKSYGPKHGVYNVSGRYASFVSSDFQEDGRIIFRTRDLGSYTILEDTIPPDITPLTWNPGYLRLKIRDDLSGIRSYRATVNDEFLLMHYDAKRNTLHARPRNPNLSIRGEFKLQVIDQAGNESIITRKL